MISMPRGLRNAHDSRASLTAIGRPVRFGRRAFAATLAGAALAWPTARSGAQESPPIEPREGEEPVDDDLEVIDPEPTIELSPDEDAGTIIEVAESTGVRYFAETGHNLDSPFLPAWQLAGGETGPGLPLSESRLVAGQGQIRQDFEALALIHDPSLPDEQSLWAAALPDTVIHSVAPASARATGAGCAPGDASCTFFPETGHSVAGALATFWQQHGHAQLIGLPRSEPFPSGSGMTQAFERAVLDLDTSGMVSMRKVNVDLAASQFPGDEAFLPVPPSLGTTTLVTAEDGLRLRSGPNADASVIAVLPNNAEFIAAPGDHDAWVPGYVDGFSGWVAAEYFAAPGAAPELAEASWRIDVWQGVTLGESNVRREPTTASATIRTIPYGTQVVVVDWVRGEPVVENQITWALLEDGGYVYARNIARSAPVQPPPLPPDAPTEGRWIDVHLTQQLIVAYEGRDAVRTVVTTTGMPGWKTPPGWYAINWRVANETMESGSIGAESFYVLKDVLFTQYFTDRGHALHYAWWKTAETIGRPGSHGCLNLLMEDARFFWEWADIGTPVICRTV